MSKTSQFLTLRRDQFSLQFTTPLSPKVFIRVDLDQTTRKKIVFSDFISLAVDMDWAFAALDSLDSNGVNLKLVEEIVVTNIAPAAGSDPTRSLSDPAIYEIFDTQVDIFRKYYSRAARKVSDSYANVRAGKIDLHVVLELRE